MSLVFEPPFRQRVWRDVGRTNSSRDNGDNDNISVGAGDGASDDDVLLRTTKPTRAASSSRSLHQPSRHQNLRYQHLASLNAALYRCLHANQFEQASRIFGMLLRFEPPGAAPAQAHVDIRRQNLWGVGAEILLRRNAPANGQSINSVHGNDRQTPLSTSSNIHLSTDHGYEEAKTFFERLILQYPRKKSHASSSSSKYANHGYRSDPLADDTVTALELYPNLFGIWIFQIQGKVLERAQNFETLRNNYQYSESDAQDELSQICDANASDILPIIERIDDVVKSPPYDQDVRLLRMQAELRLWMADVLKRSPTSAHESQRWRLEAGKILESTVGLAASSRISPSS